MKKEINKEFPSIVSSNILTDEELNSSLGGACGSSCKSSCSQSCKPGNKVPTDPGESGGQR
ncbi:MAG: hypothetical protein ACRCZM_07075 [Bacteroidales bacterium]